MIYQIYVCGSYYEIHNVCTDLKSAIMHLMNVVDHDECVSIDKLIPNENGVFVSKKTLYYWDNNKTETEREFIDSLKKEWGL